MNINAIQSQKWLDYAKNFKVAFAQVREDALIDEYITHNFLPSSSNGIMIASGGCTATLLAANQKFKHLVLVDANPAQIALTKMKINLLKDFEEKDRLNILGYTSTSLSQRKTFLLNQFHLQNLEVSSFGNFDTIVENGLDFIGRYEILFLRLQAVINEFKITEALLSLNNLEEQLKYLKSHSSYVNKLEMAFREVMDLPNLIHLFGKEATQNAVIPFSEHFFIQTLKVLQCLPAANNPYLSQILLSKLQNEYAPWIKLPKQNILTHLSYQNSSMIEALKQSDELFDFIHLSNICDWLTENEIIQLLKVVEEKLKKGGWFIIRRLNSNWEIPSICKTLYVDEKVSKHFYEKDRSYIYNKLLIGKKL